MYGVYEEYLYSCRFSSSFVDSYATCYNVIPTTLIISSFGIAIYPLDYCMMIPQCLIYDSVDISRYVILACRMHT